MAPEDSTARLETEAFAVFRTSRTRRIDLRDIRIGVINLPRQGRRKRLVSEALTDAGLPFEIIEGIRDNPRFRGCARSHLKAIETLRGDGPFLVLEDDARPTAHLVPVLDVPYEAELLYLGHSPFGAPDDPMVAGHGSDLVSDFNDDYVRVHSMLAAHAILYLDPETTDAVAASIAASCEDATLRRHDLGLCEIQSQRTVLATRAPFFRQVGNVQLAAKQALRGQSEDHVSHPAEIGALREIVSSAGAVTAVVERSVDGPPMLRPATIPPLFGIDPSGLFDGAETLDREEDLQGWNSEHPIFEAAIKARRPRRIIEVGVWKGRSTLHMARMAKTHGVDARIYAVDTWLGSPEHWLDDDLRGDLMLRNGYPTLYETFLKNVSLSGLGEMIEPVPMPSETAAVIFSRKGVRADLIHIDAGHEFDSVTRDLEHYVPLLSNDGILIGDDYGGSFRGVRRAFNRFCQNNGFTLQKIGRKCICTRSEVWDRVAAPLLV